MVMAREGNTAFEYPEPGSYAATCYKVVDIGTQESTYEGKAVKRHQVIISWELEEKMKSGEPFVISAFYTVSLSEKSKLRPMVESWRGAAFTPAELDGFNLGQLLGKPCMVSLVMSDKGKIKVGSVSKLPKGMAISELVNPIVHFDLGAYDEATFNKLSDKTKELIRKSPEYRAVITAKHANLPAEVEDGPEVPF